MSPTLATLHCTPCLSLVLRPLLPSVYQAFPRGEGPGDEANHVYTLIMNASISQTLTVHSELCTLAALKLLTYYVCVYYCSLTKKSAWAEHLTSLPIREVGTLLTSTVSAFNYKTVPMPFLATGGFGVKSRRHNTLNGTMTM